MHRASLPLISHLRIILCALAVVFGVVWVIYRPAPVAPARFTVLAVRHLVGLDDSKEERYYRPIRFLSSQQDINELLSVDPGFATAMERAPINFEHDLVLLVAPGEHAIEYETVVREVHKGQATIDIYIDFKPPRHCWFWENCIYQPMTIRNSVLLTIPRSAVDQTTTIVRLHSPDGTAEAPIINK